MKKILIVLALLLIVLPVLMIIQHLTGWNLVTEREYFYLVGIFIALSFLFEKDKQKKGADNL